MQHLENFQSSRKTFICCLPSSPSSLFLLVEVVVLCTNTLHTKGLLHYALCFLKTLKLTETSKLLNEETFIYNAMLYTKQQWVLLWTSAEFWLSLLKVRKAILLTHQLRCSRGWQKCLFVVSKVVGERVKPSKFTLWSTRTGPGG